MVGKEGIVGHTSFLGGKEAQINTSTFFLVWKREQHHLVEMHLHNKVKVNIRVVALHALIRKSKLLYETHSP